LTWTVENPTFDSMSMNTDTVKDQLLDKIIYFSLFNHPLRIDELEKFMPEYIGDSESISNVIKSIEGISISDGYILLNNYTCKKDIENRIKYEKSCKAILPKLDSNSRLISKFPFVRSIAISGSVSKGVFKEDGDIDYFVITKPNRLWVCRTFLIAYKKLFRLNSKKYFCLNYFVSEESLEIPDHNIYTSTEVAFLAPVFGQKTFDQFIKANHWYKQIHPWKDSIKIDFKLTPNSESKIKSISERALGGKIGEKLDVFFMNLSLKRWKSKFPDFDDDKMELAMRTKRNISKHHPSNFQERVIQQFEDRKNKIKLSLNGYQ